MPLGFPGQYFDQESGNFYNYFRDYDPSTGRCLQSDPIGLQGGLNTYSYVYNNPHNLIDPKGLNAGVVAGGVAVGICARFPSACGAAIGAGICAITGMCNGSDETSGSNVIPFPGQNDDRCPPDDEPDDPDCGEWRALLQLQRDSILANFLRGAISIAEFNKLVLEHNQSVEFYKIECANASADGLKL